MIKIDTSELNKNGMVEMCISGNPIELATEALALISCLKQSIKTRRSDKDLGEMDAMIFETFFLSGLKKSLEAEMKCMKAEEIKDIRSADFISDEEFKKWFREGDE